MYTSLVFLTAFAIACVSGKSQPGPICPCTREYMPVCGEDGITYGNKCELKCAGVPKLRKGKCPNCRIPTILDPVCGENLRTYSNKYVPKCLAIPCFIGPIRNNCRHQLPEIDIHWHQN